MTEQSKPRPQLRVYCTWCDGKGYNVAYVAHSSGNTLPSPRPCGPCDGTGRLIGFRPPV